MSEAVTAAAVGSGHAAVLMEETLDGLALRCDGRYVDGTYGRGGHSAAILARLGGDGRLLALDQDPEAVRDGRQRFAGDDRFEIEHRGFEMLGEAVTERDWSGRVSGILLDLGVSSPQLDAPGRGFSFLRDGPLDMRMDPDRGDSAAAWLARADEAEIVRVLKVYGEERYARRIARAVIARRAAPAEQGPLRTTAELAGLIEQVVPRAKPGRRPHKHPATRSFQAIRIHVNRELEQLEAVLPQCLQALESGGRLAVISFHSLEDRMVKRFMRDHSRGPQLPREVPVTADQGLGSLRLIGKQRRAGEQELAANPRARSAVLRVAERRR